MPYEVVRPKSIFADWMPVSVVVHVTMPTVPIIGLSDDDAVIVHATVTPVPPPPVVPAVPVAPAALPPEPGLLPLVGPVQPNATKASPPQRAARFELHRIDRLLRGWGSRRPTTPTPRGFVARSRALHRAGFQYRHVPGRGVAAVAADQPHHPGAAVVDAREPGAIFVLQR